jgi:hypothetical protein
MKRRRCSRRKLLVHSHFHGVLVSSSTVLTATVREYLVALKRIYLVADRPFQNSIAIY